MIATIDKGVVRVTDRTMTIDNFDRVSQFIPEVFDGDTFLYTELLDRGKRSGNNKGRIVRTYYHRTRADLLDQRDAIIALCEHTGARAYTRLSPRSFRKVGELFVRHVVDQALTGNWEGMRHGYSRACGTSAPTTKLWLFDFDDASQVDLEAKIAQRPEYVTHIPSRSRYHLVTRPFDVRQLGDLGPVQVHKDNPTNLYIPENAE